MSIFSRRKKSTPSGASSTTTTPAGSANSWPAGSMYSNATANTSVSSLGDDMGDQPESGTDTSTKKRKIHFLPEDIEFDDVVGQLSEPELTALKESILPQAKRTGKGKERRALETRISKLLRSNRRMKTKSWRTDDYEGHPEAEVCDTVAEIDSRVRKLAEGSTVSEADLQSVVRVEMAKMNKELSKTPLPGWAATAEPCPRKGQVYLSNDADHMTDTHAMEDFIKSNDTEPWAQGLTQEEWAEAYRRRGSRCHTLSLDDSNAKSSFSKAALPRKYRDPKDWSPEQRNVVEGLMKLESYLQVNGASAAEIKSYTQAYVCQQTQSHQVSTSSDGKTTTVRFNPYHLGKAGGIEATLDGKGISVSAPCSNQWSDQTPVRLNTAAATPFAIVDASDYATHHKFMLDLADAKKGAPPKLKYTATGTDARSIMEKSDRLTSWAASGLEQVADPAGAMINRLSTVSRMSDAFRRKYKSGKFDLDRATQLSEWLYNCKYTAYTINRDKAVVFTEKHLQQLEDSVREYVGADTTDTPRQIMVTGIEAMMSKPQTAWDGRTMDKWITSLEGSQPFSAEQAIKRLVSKYEYSLLLESKLSEGQADSSTPFTLDPDQMTKISTYITDQKVKPQAFDVVYSKLRANPKWVPTKNDRLPETEAATSTRPTTTDPNVTTQGQPEATKPAGSSADLAPGKLPKLQYVSTGPSSSGEPPQPQSVRWSIYDTESPTPDQVESACDEALHVLSATHGLREKYPKLNWSSAATMSKWMSDLEGPVYKIDTSTGQVGVEQTHLPEIEKSISEYMQAAGLTEIDKPTEVFKAALVSSRSDFKAYDGRSLRDWSKRPAGRPGTAEALSAAETFGRLSTLADIQGILTSQLPESAEPTQVTEMSTWLVDQGKQIMPAFQQAMGELGKDLKWKPGPNYVLSEAASEPAESSTTGTSQAAAASSP